MIISTKFCKDRTKIVDFLLLAKFWACLLFFHSPSTYLLNLLFLYFQGATVGKLAKILKECEEYDALKALTPTSLQPKQ